MNHPLVSIIMGVYNCETTVGECIESVINQTFTDWEFIICDDCSTDNTKIVINEYAEKDDRIIYLHNDKNSKLAYSLNRCLQQCRGDYIARMDADDVCYARRLQTQVDFLNKNTEYAVVGTAVDVFDGESVISVRVDREIPEPKNLLLGPCYNHPTIMMRKSVYDSLGGYTVSERTNRGQDWDLWFRFYQLGYKGYNIQEPLVRYHESKDDYKKRTFKTAWMYTRTALYGYKILHFPIRVYPIAFKPLLSALIPSKLMYIYHNRKKLI